MLRVFRRGPPSEVTAAPWCEVRRWARAGVLHRTDLIGVPARGTLRLEEIRSLRSLERAARRERGRTLVLVLLTSGLAGAGMRLAPDAYPLWTLLVAGAGWSWRTWRLRALWTLSSLPRQDVDAALRAQGFRPRFRRPEARSTRMIVVLYLWAPLNRMARLFRS